MNLSFLISSFEDPKKADSLVNYNVFPKPVSVVLSIGVENIPSLNLAKKLGYNLVDTIEEDEGSESVYLKYFY